jgi:hypothetical protein
MQVQNDWREGRIQVVVATIGKRSGGEGCGIVGNTGDALSREQNLSLWLPTERNFLFLTQGQRVGQIATVHT